MVSTSGLLPAEVRLKRFLHYGSESPLCLPGDRFFLQSFLSSKLSAIESMIVECAPDKQGEAVNHILKAFTDGYSAYPECLIFALAMCANQKSSEVLRTQAYRAVKKVCKTPKDLFLFATFMRKLSAPAKGYGVGMRKALSDWYLSKEPLDMADCVSQVRGAYGFTHRDLVKLCHLKSDDIAKAAIICYVLKGLEAAKMQSDIENPSVQKVFSYLEVVEEVKHLSDQQSCARLIEAHNFPIGVVPSPLLKSAEIWIAVVPTMPLRELLENLIRLSCNGLLRSGQPLESHIVDRLMDQSAIVESNLHPTEVFCAIKHYENHAKNTHEMMEKLVKQGKLEKQLKPPPKPNAKILVALEKLLISTFKLLVPTGMRYLVALDLSSNMKSWRCNGARNVKPAQAATLLALCLLHAEREVTVTTFPTLPGAPPEEDVRDPENVVLAVFSRRGKVKGIVHPRRTEVQPMIPLSLDKELTVVQNLEKISETSSGPVEVCQPIVWAQQCKKPVDIFIVITDYVTVRKREIMEPAAALQDYRREMNLPNSKLVTCALAANTLDVAASHDPGMIDIVGFDGKFARIIEAFSRGAF